MARQRIELYLKLIFVFLGALAALLSLKTYISDSEFWAVTASKQLFEPGASASVYMKILFYAVLKPIYALPLDNISHVLVARMEFAVVGSLTAFVFYRVARLIFDTELEALLITVLLTTCTLFLSQSFRIRSDNFASLLNLVVMWIVLNHARKENGRWIGSSLAIFALNTLLIATTPKSIYFLMIGGLFTALLQFPKLKRQQKAIMVGVAFVAPPFALASLFEIVTWIPAFRWIERAATLAYDYFQDSFAGLAGQGSYLSEADFVHVFALLRQNPVLDVFLLASLVLWILDWRTFSDRARGAYLSLLVVSVFLMIFHNQKLPFFIYSLLPTLVLGAGCAWKARFSSKTSAVREKTVATVVAACMTTAALHTYLSLKETTNSEQIEALSYLQRAMESEQPVTYYDAIGLLPRLNQIFAFPSPNDRNNPILMKVVENKRPTVILYVTRTLELEPRMGFFLAEYYSDLGAGIWVSKNADTSLREHIGVPPLHMDLRYLFGFDIPY